MTIGKHYAVWLIKIKDSRAFHAKLPLDFKSVNIGNILAWYIIKNSILNLLFQILYIFLSAYFFLNSLACSGDRILSSTRAPLDSFIFFSLKFSRLIFCCASKKFESPRTEVSNNSALNLSLVFSRSLQTLSGLAACDCIVIAIRMRVIDLYIFVIVGVDVVFCRTSKSTRRWLKLQTNSETVEHNHNTEGVDKLKCGQRLSPAPCSPLFVFPVEQRPQNWRRQKRHGTND